MSSASQTPAYTGVRAYPRVPVDVSAKVFTASGRVTFGRLHDMSLGGVAVYAPVDMEDGELIRVQFELPSSRVKFGISATVRNRNGFRYGLQWKEITEAERKELERALSVLSVTR